MDKKKIVWRERERKGGSLSLVCWEMRGNCGIFMVKAWSLSLKHSFLKLPVFPAYFSSRITSEPVH